jgi:hypothetical protein
MDVSIPKPEEIRQYLECMLCGKRFRGAPSQSQFLALVVTLALAGEEIKESTIAAALFPNYLSHESADVRVTALNLRNRLRRYYAQEGSQDRVIISLPEPQHCRGTNLPTRKAYTPLFSYNPRFSEKHEGPEEESAAPEPFVSAARAAHFVDVKRRYLLVLARQGIAGAYPLGTGTKRKTWVFRLSELASAIANRNTPIPKPPKCATIPSGSASTLKRGKHELSARSLTQSTPQGRRYVGFALSPHTTRWQEV